jgi:hypothetical protein
MVDVRKRQLFAEMVFERLGDQPGQLYEILAPWVQGGAGMGWMCSRGSNLAPGPLGSVAGDGDPDWRRGWPLPCLSSVPAAGGWRPGGMRPRVFSAHRPLPQL